MFSTAEVGCILSFLMTLYSTKSVYFPSDLNDFLELDEETRYTDIYCSSTMTYMNMLWGVHSCSLTPPFGRPMLSEALSFALLTPPQKKKIKNWRAKKIKSNNNVCCWGRKQWCNYGQQQGIVNISLKFSVIAKPHCYSPSFLSGIWSSLEVVIKVELFITQIALFYSVSNFKTRYLLLYL